MANKNRVGTSIYRFMTFYEETVIIESIDHGNGKIETAFEAKATSFRLSEKIKVRRKQKESK